MISSIPIIVPAEHIVNPADLTTEKLTRIFGEIPDVDFVELVAKEYPDDMYLMEDRETPKQREERYFLIADLNRAARCLKEVK